MKLAEALQERADLNRQIEQLRSRLSHNAIVQEGEAPAEDPGDLLAQLDRATARLEELMAGKDSCGGVVECIITVCLPEQESLYLRSWMLILQRL